MKTPEVLEPPTAAARKPTANSGPEREAESVIDTSKMNRGQREALELTEAARGPSGYRSFAGELFMGRCALDHVYPFPLQPATDVAAGRPFLAELNYILKHEVD